MAWQTLWWIGLTIEIMIFLAWSLIAEQAEFASQCAFDHSNHYCDAVVEPCGSTAADGLHWWTLVDGISQQGRSGYTTPASGLDSRGVRRG